MWCVNKRQIENNESSYTIKYNFMYDSISELKSYRDYLNKFRGFTLDEYEDELKNEGYQSYSNIVFFLRHREDFSVLFSMTLEIANNITDYTYYFNEYETNNITEQNINDMLNKYKNTFENLYIEIVMNTKFYCTMSLLNDLETDDEEFDNEIPSIIENSFNSDSCLVCLTNKPNILNFPCLHLSVCERCEETGCFINWSICRVKIERKVKI